MRRKAYQLTRAKYLDQEEQLELSRTLTLIDGSRDALIIETGIATGAREAEILDITPEDISEQCVYIRGLKGSLDRTIPLKPDFYKKLEKYASAFEHGTRIFPITTRRVRQIWAGIRPGQKKFHALRHTFALNLYSKTRDLRLTQIALGHTNVQNTQIYAHVADSLDLLKRALL